MHRIREIYLINAVGGANSTTMVVMFVGGVLVMMIDGIIVLFLLYETYGVGVFCSRPNPYRGKAVKSQHHHSAPAVEVAVAQCGKRPSPAVEVAVTRR